ncbi:MAG: Unknown protein [uncultured Thiotrichaceae bacterium]|uniref:Uncharacterized protein n=1 Tax=uncultured Thiotrichaceae bacterium TaxID=298394 RepID=A0A6S6SDD2_9GAMM|nr:MAG: Unknown protein [uncultured Thiotrichaceae bacterium]
MFSELRKPFLVAAFITCILSLLLQVGSAFASTDEPPGLAILYLSLMEMLIIFSLGLMLLSLIIGPRVQGRLQGILTIVFSIFIISMAAVMIVKALAQLTMMISLLVAAPFGTIVYLGTYGSFDTAVSQGILGLLLVLKLALFALLIAAHQRFIQNKGLMRLLLISIGLILLTTFLHTIVPGILVSITDAVAALIVAILALIGAVIFLVFSIPPVLKALRLDRA